MQDKTNISFRNAFQKLIDFAKFLTDEKMKYGKEVFSIYHEYYSEIIEEIQGFADGQNYDFDKVFSFLVGVFR